MLEAAERMVERDKAMVMAAAVGAAMRSLVAKQKRGKQEKSCFNRDKKALSQFYPSWVKMGAFIFLSGVPQKPSSSIHEDFSIGFFLYRLPFVT